MPLFHDASPTWSGFSYQGKVGLYVVLKKLNSYNGENIQNVFENWKLEFEWLEDFSIKDGNTYISIHQVKAYNNRSYSKYKIAINQLALNAYLQDYTQVTSQIKHYLHVIRDVNFNKECLYEYTIRGMNQKYCSLNEIDNIIQEQIGIFVERHNIPDNNDEAIVIHFNKLLAIIDDHVKRRHHIIQTQPIRTRQIEYIDFLEIINALRTDSNQLNQNRILYEKKEYLSRIVDEFCQNKSNEIEIKINETCRELLDLEDNDFIYFIKSISPHIQVNSDNFMTLLDFQSLLQKDATKGSFLKSMSKIHGFNIFIQRKFLEKLDKKYLPTTINREEEAKEEICQDILENPFAIENLFELDCFITERITCESIEEDAYNTTEIRDEDLPDRDSQEYKISELKKVEMVKIEDAERILNA